MLGIEGQGKEVGGVTAEEEGLLSIGVDGRSKKKKSYLVANKNSEHCNTGWLTIKKMSKLDKKICALVI